MRFVSVIYIPLPGVFFSLTIKDGRTFFFTLPGDLCLCVPRVMYMTVGSAFLDAYREYLDRMFDESDDLVVFDVFTVPADVDPESPSLREFGDFA